MRSETAITQKQFNMLVANGCDPELARVLTSRQASIEITKIIRQQRNANRIGRMAGLSIGRDPSKEIA